MTFLVWHILAIVSIITVSFVLGFIAGKSVRSVWEE